ncbi:hypothetical protein [Streptomyces olivaceus]|uniref:hypothetical protein n=1 Tax=Streptomyces olivaceus TaxID=47716 RepID=UPI001CCDC607|nr:hypothetical protein [Streptomyces olivaceus]MBZ6142272.1 hypothetical protein [Streptomyces olivaceus]MBZ6170043.1 hypothetical protein [Streptomyces olivaceus]
MAEARTSLLRHPHDGRLNRLGELSEADGTPGDVSANFRERPVPEELTELVRYHSYRIAKYLYFAVDEGHCRDDLAEWQRNTLYKPTDALEHLHPLEEHPPHAGDR